MRITDGIENDEQSMTIKGFQYYYSVFCRNEFAFFVHLSSFSLFFNENLLSTSFVPYIGLSAV